MTKDACRIRRGRPRRRLLALPLSLAVLAAGTLTVRAQVADISVKSTAAAAVAAGSTIVDRVGSIVGALSGVRVPVHVVLTADTDGSNAAQVTEADIAGWLAKANTHWTGALRFELDSVVSVNDTKLSRDVPCMEGAKPGYWACSVDIQADAREAYALQPSLRDKLVVFVRHADGGGWSNAGAHFLVVSDAEEPTMNLFSHEAGHYFWNDHTFGVQPMSEAEAADEVREYVEKWNLSKDQGLGVFDADQWKIKDTPPDPGKKFWHSVKGDKCAVGPGSATHALPVTFTDGVTHTYTLEPDRSNIMSYYTDCETMEPFAASPDQRAYARRSVEEFNRGTLTGKEPRYLEMHQVPLRSDEAGATGNWPHTFEPGQRSVLPFTWLHSRYMFVLEDDGAIAKAIRLSGREPVDGRFFDWDSLDGIVAWTGPWDPAFSMIETFAAGGERYIVAHDPATSRTRTYLFDDYAADDKVVQLVSESNWPRPTPSRMLSPWSIVKTFDWLGTPYGVRYSSGAGILDLFKLNADGSAPEPIVHVSVPAGFDIGMPVIVPPKGPGQTKIDGYLVLYDKETGNATSFRVLGAGAKGESTGTANLGTYRSSLAPYDRGATDPRFMSYSSASRTNAPTMRAYRLTSLAPLSVQLLMEVSWTRESEIVPFRMQGFWSFLQYNNSTGEAKVHKIIH